jgi:hypothetical protein
MVKSSMMLDVVGSPHCSMKDLQKKTLKLLPKEAVVFVSHV